MPKLECGCKIEIGPLFGEPNKILQLRRKRFRKKLKERLAFLKRMKYTESEESI
jgi:hypothetical protein